MTPSLRRPLAWLAYTTGLTDRVHRNRVRHAPYVALLYHRVYGNPMELGQIPMGEIHIENLRSQLRWLARNCIVENVRSWFEGRQAPARHGPPHVLITFDDGYQDFARYAVPVCAALRIRPLVFLSTGFIDDPEDRPWWDWFYRARFSSSRSSATGMEDWRRVAFADPEQAGAKVRQAATPAGWEFPDPPDRNEFCTWNELRALRGNADFGCHGTAHLPLALVSPERMRKDIETSRRRIEVELGESPNWFAYPYGDAETVNAAVTEAIQRIGFKVAFRADGPFDARRSPSPWEISRAVFPPRPAWSFAAHWTKTAIESR